MGRRRKSVNHRRSSLPGVPLVKYFVLSACLGILTPIPAIAATTYTVTDLGTLGGTSSYGTAISESGKATGASLLSGGQTHAFIWDAVNGMQDLGAIGGGDSHGLDISDDNIVGDTSGQAFRYTPATGMVLIDGANTGAATGLNAGKSAVGYRDNGVASRIRTWSPSDVPASIYPASDLRAVAVNDLGQFVGVNTSASGGIYSPGSGPFTPLGTFVPTDVDSTRLITGSIGGIAALLDFDTNTTTLLGKLSPTDAVSRALGISPTGTIVGVSGAISGNATRAFVTDTTSLTIQDLTSLLDISFAGWTILSADDVNSTGQIIGVGQFGGVSHAVILTPVPEPSTWLLAAVAALPLAFHRRTRCHR